MSTVTVNRSSWHARAYRWMGRTDENPSVCDYWGYIFLLFMGLPVACVLLLVVGPIIWVAEKLEARCKGKEICPFGRIEFK